MGGGGLLVVSRNSPLFDIIAVAGDSSTTATRARCCQLLLGQHLKTAAHCDPFALTPSTPTLLTATGERFTVLLIN